MTYVILSVIPVFGNSFSLVGLSVAFFMLLSFFIFSLSLESKLFFDESLVFSFFKSLVF